MHLTSMNEMKLFIDRYVKPSDTVLDVGSQVVDQQNMSYRQLLSNNQYIGIDICKGENVDVVVEPYNWPIADKNIDVVICGQALEHIEYPWLTFTEMFRVLKDGGYCCVIAPSRIPLHRYPIDTYRFNPDGMMALGKWAGFYTVNTYIIQTHEMDDCVGIFKKQASV